MSNKLNLKNLKYIFIIVFAVLFTWVLHQFGHWLIGSLHYNMVMTLNSTFSSEYSGYVTSDEKWRIDAAGTLVTLIEAFIVFLIILHSTAKKLYPFLITCFYMRLLALVLSFQYPNDDTRLSTWIWFEKSPLPIIVTFILFIFVYKITKQYNFNIKFNLLNVAMVILFSSVLILTDMYFPVKLLESHAHFHDPNSKNIFIDYYSRY
jgi:hypothetical protein